MKADPLSTFVLQWTAQNINGQWTFCTPPSDGTPVVCLGYYGGLYDGNVFCGVQAEDLTIFGKHGTGTLALFDIPDGQVGEPIT